MTQKINISKTIQNIKKNIENSQKLQILFLQEYQIFKKWRKIYD